MTSVRSSRFGDLLRQYRTAARLTQAELAEQAGISLRGLAALENGERLRPHRDTIRLLADALQMASGARTQFEAVARGRDGMLGRTPLGNPDQVSDPSLTPLVGRACELELLEWHLAGDGPPVLVISGEPGIGKTRLLRHAADQAARQGQTVITGGCQRRSGQEPYAPFPQTLARYLATLPDPRVQRAVCDNPWLVRLLPELAPLLPEPLTSSSLPAGQERRLLFDAVARLLANLAHGESTVLMLDDLQWAPIDALDLLTALVHDPASAHLRVICAYRSTELWPRDPLAVILADLAHAGLARHCEIAALSPSEAEQLLVSLVDELDPQSPAVQRAVTRTGGVPYYLVSYAQELRAQAVGLRHDVPWSVAHSLRQRVAALPPLSREILEVATVAGREVPRVLLGSLIDRPEEEVLAGVEAACQARLLEEANEHAYQFPHDVIREVIGAELGAARWKSVHRQVAQALEKLPERIRSGGAAELAWHFLEGDDTKRALRYSLLAGDEATTAFAHEEAERHYRTALDLARELDNVPTQVEALQKLGVVLMTAGQLDEALLVVEQAAEQCRAAGMTVAEARVVAQIGRVQERRGAIEDGIERLKPLLPCLEQIEDADPSRSLALAELSLALGDLYFEAGRYPEQLEAAERATELAYALRQNHLVTDGERQRGLALSMLGRRDESLRAWTAALPLMEATGDLYNLSHTLNNLSACAPNLERAMEYGSRALTAAERLGDPLHIAFILAETGGHVFTSGRWDEARSYFERAWELSGLRGYLDLASAYAALHLGELCLSEGNVAQGRSWLERCLSIAGGRTLLGLRLAHQALAEQDLFEGRPDSALARLEPLLDRSGLEEAGVTHIMPTLARTWLERGDRERAEETATQGLRRATLMGYQTAVVNLLLVQGVIAGRGSRLEEAERTFRAAVALAQRLPYPFAEARALYECGVMSIHAGEPKRGRECLEDAVLIFRRLGAQPYIERTEGVLAVLASGH